MKINIYQGIQSELDYANVNIIIDVIRAFTVSYYAFVSNVKEIQLVDTIENALAFKEKSKEYILSGEVLGYKIKEFDYGNSPYDISNINLNNKKLVQKTTNGVTATLNALNAKNIFVTGFVNYMAVVKKVKILENQFEGNEFIVNIIASHPTGDEDLACAELIEDVLFNNANIRSLEEKTISRILKSDASYKFIDDSNQEFSVLDLLLCVKLIEDDFVMSLSEIADGLPIIYKEEIKC